MAEIKLTFVGDVMCQQMLLKQVARSNGGWSDVFADVKHLFVGSDYVIGNLESPVAPSKRLSYEKMCFNAPLDLLTSAKEAGFNFMSTANNHIWDRGVQGLDETLASLRRAGLQTTGAYDNREDADKIFIINVKGVRVAIVACTYEVNFGRPQERITPEKEWKVDLLKKPRPYPFSRFFVIKRALLETVPLEAKLRLSMAKEAILSPQRASYCPESVRFDEIGAARNEPYRQRVEAKIRRAKELADLVVLLPHVGGQHNPAPGRYHEYTMRWMAEAGADLIVAGHSHLPQKAYVMPTGTLAAYCLGDFVFSMAQDRFNTGFQTNCSIVLNVFVDGQTKKIARADFVPCAVPEGSSMPRPLARLYAEAKSEGERERLLIDNETIVRSVRGGVLPVGMREVYNIPLNVAQL